MTSTTDPNQPERDDETEDTVRGLFQRPQGEECPRGHLDWEIVTSGNRWMKRCRICAFIRPLQEGHSSQ